MQQYKVEILDDHGNWIHKSWHKNPDNARIMAEVQEEAGYQVRIIHNGKIMGEKL